METSTNSNVSRIAILGSAGQVGSAITQMICKRFPNAEVLACMRSRIPSSVNPLPANCRETVFDPLGNEWNNLGKLDWIINSIGIIEETKILSFEQAHIGITRRILAHRNVMGNPGIIQVSVLGADENSSSPFMRTKALADGELMKQPKTWLVRPSIVCTHNTMMVQELKLMRSISHVLLNTLVFPSRLIRTKMQPVLGDDVAEVISRICLDEPEEQIIPLTGPEIFQFCDLIKICNPKIRILPFPEPLFRGSFLLASKMFPKLLKKEQFNLLGTDNIAEPTVAERILKRKMGSTLNFWNSELK
jgi:hypothetical protein